MKKLPSRRKSWNRQQLKGFIMEKLNCGTAGAKRAVARILDNMHISQLRNFADHLGGETPHLFERSNDEERRTI
jgi:hypothetical protein